MPVNKIAPQLLLLAQLCLGTCFYPASAQRPHNALAFNTLGINDGLSQGMVTRIIQDRYGFMWFATLDGLNRYDGYKFTVYRHDPRDERSITESYAQVLFEDSKGRLWIGTVSGGLDLYDAETETYLHINKLETEAGKLSEGPVNGIAEDKDGNIWVLVYDNLQKISIADSKKNGRLKISVQRVRAPAITTKSLLTITKSGHIYFADCRKGILYKLKNEATQEWEVVWQIKDEERQQNSLPTIYTILQFVEDKENGKLYLFHQEGVTRFNESTSVEEKLFPGDGFTTYDSPLRAALDKSGIIWFSSLNTLACFDTHSGNISNAIAVDPKQAMLVKSAYSPFIDRSGLLWIGTSGYGLLKRNIRSESFHHVSGGANYSIREDDKGKILLGNGTTVREIFDRTTATSKAVAPDEIKNYNRYLNLPLASDGFGDWFVEELSLRYQPKNGLAAAQYPLPVTINNEYQHLIQCRIKDEAGNIWLGTTQGLLRFDIKRKGWTIFRANPKDHNTLSSNVIFSLCLDPGQPQQYLWVGTGGGGLNRFDMQSGKSLTYTTKDGLPNNVIYGILPDDAGHLWMSSNKGLSCFDIQQKIFKNFDYKDGLQSNEFNRGAYWRARDGWLFFGGVNGFNYFSPRQILTNTTIPQVVITGLKIRNEPVQVQSEGSPLTKPIYLTHQLQLSYQENFLSFEFASMDFNYPEKNRYQFKLTGLDKDWIDAGTTNSATYTNLDPGTYSFMVRGSNNDGTWNKRASSVDLVILPPWYLSWWFRTGIVLLVLSALYLFYRYRLAQALKLQAIRNGIADDLHDEVGSNLSNIYIFSNVAQQKEKANESTAPLLQKITDYTKQSMEAINDIVWMVNTRNDEFENIMAKMRTLAGEFSETCDCNLFIDLDESLNHIKLDIEKRKNFYLIYKEAINNLAKYAACKNVWIEMKLVHKTVTLLIRDDGKGFDPATKRTGNGMLNMKKRAQVLGGHLEVSSAVGKGTSLQLSFNV
jgi:ligand-binding sensor domain-containing protein/two-component sensor histidine kinase